MRHQTTQWHLDTPEAPATQFDPSVILSTIHPRGDQRILKCIQSLLARRVRVHVVWLGEPSGHARFDDWLTETVLPKAHSTKERLLSTFETIRRADSSGNASILYVHDYYMLPHALWWKSRRSGRRIVFDSHEFYPELYSAKCPRAMRPAARAAIVRLSRIMFRNVDAFSLVSADMMTTEEAGDRPVIITPNFPSASLFPNRSEPADSERINRVIHTGSLNPGYGAEVLVRAAALLDRREIDIRIDALERFPSESDRQWFENQLRKHGNPKSLRMIPARPAAEMQPLMEQYGVGLALIQRVGQNEMLVATKLYEYATAGLAVLASDLRVQERFIRESPGVTGDTFKAGSAEDLVDKLVQLQSSPATLLALDASTRYARDAFSWDATCGPLFEIFRSL